MTTEHLEDALWFRDPEDFAVGMNLVAVQASVSAAVVLVFILMSNHVHFVLYGTRKEAEEFVQRFKGRYSQYYCRKWGVKEFLRRNKVNIIELPDEPEVLERAIAYVLMNCVAAGICTHPSLYPWGCGSALFKVPVSEVKMDRNPVNRASEWPGERRGTLERKWRGAPAGMEQGAPGRMGRTAPVGMEQGIPRKKSRGVPVGMEQVTPGRKSRGTPAGKGRGVLVKIGDLSLRARARLLHSAVADLPAEWALSDAGYVLPESFIGADAVERLFRTPQRLDYFLRTSSKARKRLEMEEESLPSFKDQVLLGAVPDLCQSLFQKKYFAELEQTQKTEILRQLRYRFSACPNQLSRVCGLSYAETAKLLDAV